MIPPLLIKERIERIAAETGEPIGAVVEDGICYLTENVPLRVQKADFSIMHEELAMKVCPINEWNTISDVLRNSRIDRRQRDRQRQEQLAARAARKRDYQRRSDDALSELVEDLRNLRRGRVIVSG